MTVFKTTLLAAAMTAALGFAPAHAGLLGSTANSQYYAYGSTYNGLGSPATFVVDNGAHSQFWNAFNIIVTDTQIIYNYNDASSTWSPSGPSLNSGGLYIDNGNLLSFLGAPVINTVTVDAATNMVGFGAGNVTFDGSQVAVAWANLSFQRGTQVVLNIDTGRGNGVPEPSTLALFGLAGLVAFGRRRLSR